MKTIKVIQTCRDTSDRLTAKDSVAFGSDNRKVEWEVVRIYEEVKYQEIEGFGGAFTEAASATLDKMSEQRREEALKAYFDKEEGIGYNFCRTPINSCDFALGNYSYDDVPGDAAFTHFSIERDTRSLIPMIQQAMRIAPDMLLMASPWSPPAWMKTTGQMNGGGELKEEYREAWAEYTSRYITEYEKLGVPIWGVTVQNEANAEQQWDSCLYSPEQERDFVEFFLGPIYEKNGHGDKKIVVWDHNKDRLVERAQVMMSSPGAAKYVDGIGVHWYTGDHFDALDITHDLFPQATLYHTEGCVAFDPTHNVWSNAELYAHDMIGNLNNWVAGWMDWNLVLDEKGGPNHVDNYCSAPVIADTQQDKIIYEPSYYYIGHFSKYIKRGARRVGHSVYTAQLEVTAFENPDGEMVVVLMNQTDQERNFTLRCKEGVVTMVAAPHSIMTLLY